MKTLFRFLSKIGMERFLLDRGIDIRPPTGTNWGKELRVPSDSEWKGILRKEAKEREERRRFIDAPGYKDATHVFGCNPPPPGA